MAGLSYQNSSLRRENTSHDDDDGDSVSVSLFRRTLLGYYAEGMHTN